MCNSVSADGNHVRYCVQFENAYTCARTYGGVNPGSAAF